MINRRRFITMAGAGVCLPSTSPPKAIAATASTGVVTVPLNVGEVEVDLAGTLVKTLGYNGNVPGPEIRIKEGETLRVPVHNGFSEPTLVHWHGISLINSMDGTSLVQPPIKPGENFDYEFVVPEAGTHWYHSHFGLQADRGLYGALIVEPRVEELSYDREYTLILDDWSDGVEIKQSSETGDRPIIRRIGGYGSFAGGADVLAEIEEDVAQTISFGGRAYPFMLINGQVPDDPAVFDVRKGERIRLRIINAAADTAFRFAVAEHKLTVTHSDGMPVEPVEVDTVRIGMAERYDVLIEANNPGAFQIGIIPEGKTGFGRAILRYRDAASSSLPAADIKPKELNQRLLTYADLVGKFPAKVMPNSVPDRVYNMTLHHTNIHVEGLEKGEPLMVSEGEIVRFNFINKSDNWHPMHMHGHHFHLDTVGRPLKDTAVIAARGGTATWDWHADNPGRWMMHCHNLYHMKDGMMRTIFYE